MEQELEQVKTAVAGYSPSEEGNHQKTLRDLLAAVTACREYVKENSQTDRGCAQRMVRELEEILSSFPGFARLASDKKALNRLHTKQLAEEHMQLIEDHFSELVKNEEKSENKQIHKWVKDHPVLGELKKNIKKASPKGAYVLLFREEGDGALQLITHTTNDGRVFTRIRPHEFRDDIKLHQTYLNEPIVGAALIVEKDLLAVIGKVPQPDESKEDEAEQKQAQLQKLLSVSSKAAGKPALEFIQINDVLKELHEMSRRRRFPKDSYVLLFQKQGDVADVQSALTSADANVSADVEASLDSNESGDSANENIADSDAATESEVTAESVNEDVSNEPIEADATENIEELASEDAASDESAEISEESTEIEAAADDAEDSDAEEADLESEEAIDSVTTFESADSSDDAQEIAAEESSIAKRTYASDLEIVVKKSNDGKVISRFWPVDFAIRHKLFDAFRDKPSVVGAAIIKHTELVQTLGVVPQPAEGQTDLAAFMSISRTAVEKPFAEFVADNPVLKGLHEFATGEQGNKESHVILFTQAEGSKLEILSLQRDRGKPIARIPIGDFKNAKILHERFAGKQVVGASVISGGVMAPTRFNDRHSAPPYKRGQDGPGNKRPDGPSNKRPGDGQRGRTQVVDARPVVLAAFGKTPLRQSLLATPENLQRFGINV
jgi:hypothetical protein